MEKEYPLKATPRSIAVFGAGGRMGRQVAEYIAYAAPSIRLRLLTSSESGSAPLRERFPDGDILVANYLDRGTLDQALDQMEGVFVVTPSGLDEGVAMNNFIAAARRAGSASHIVRLVGYAPEWPPTRIPAHLLEMGGDADQHFIAKQVLQDSGLPITFLNLGASLMDNLLFTAAGIRRARTLIWPKRSVPLMDVRDLGEVIAKLFLSDDARHIGSFHTVNNGYDYPTTRELAQVMSEAFLTPISNDPSWDSFNAEYGAILNARGGRAIEAEYRYRYFEFEDTNWLWTLNDFAESLLGRRPNSLHSWLREHRHHFLGDI